MRNIVSCIVPVEDCSTVRCDYGIVDIGGSPFYCVDYPAIVYIGVGAQTTIVDIFRVRVDACRMAGKPDSFIIPRPLIDFDVKLVGNGCVGIVIVGVETQARVSLDVERGGACSPSHSPVLVRGRGLEKYTFVDAIELLHPQIEVAVIVYPCIRAIYSWSLTPNP